MEKKDLSDVRERLYGSSRTQGRDVAKRLQQEDHVLVNFQKGAEPFDSLQSFRSETTASFRHHPPSNSTLPSHLKWSPSSQNVTHLKFGSDFEPSTSVVRSDYTTKPIPKRKLHIPEGLHDIHLADMAPQYMADKSFGRSLYSSDFDGTKSYDVWSSQLTKEGKKVGRRHKTTQYQKATHFELGSDVPSLESETSGCFTARGPPTADMPSHNHTSVAGVDRSKSNVFRPGDYDISPLTSKDHFLSVQQQDFGSKLSPAGVSSATRKGYSHVFPRKPSGQAPNALQGLLTEKNTMEFQNPRDPTAINVMQAFLKYDKNRSGCISVDELKAVCGELGTPITDQEIADMLKECDINGDGNIDYVEFTKHLTAHTEPQSMEKEFLSTHPETYSRDGSRQQVSKRSSEEAFMGVEYQTSTHFQLGNHKESPSSIYHNDFGPESVRGTKKSPVAPAPPSSKVMHELPVVSPDTTTSRKAFIKHDIAGREGDRLSSLITNRGRHEDIAVVLSCGRDDDNSHYKASIMGSSYHSPPLGTTPARMVNPTPKDFHHLESNRALPCPPPGPGKSEAQACFGVPVKSREEGIGRMRGALRERTSRIKDNKGTHFILGFDDSLPLSEKRAEFAPKEPLHPGHPAAGKPSGPTKGYSVIGHDSGEVKESPDDKEGSGLQNLLQQRNFLRNVNPRDPLNINLRKAFLEYDKDLSGTVSKEEVKLVCRGMRVDMSETELEGLIARCDKNGDGHIDYHEFAMHLLRQQPPLSTEGMTTTSRKDFKHPSKQSLTPMQKVVVEQDSKRWVPLQPTHFFHLDTREDYLRSTTRKDFIPPEENSIA